MDEAFAVTAPGWCRFVARVNGATSSPVSLALFPTRVYRHQWRGSPWQRFNSLLLNECRQFRDDDVGGQRWSEKNYFGGYTSYHSLCRMQALSPTFARLEKKLHRHVAAFAAELEWDLASKPLIMTDCWINIMPQGVHHSGHIHPLSALSGTYYVRAPRGSPGLKFEDPRLGRFMAAPPRRADCSTENRVWHTEPAATGKFVLFESWLRHEVAANPVSSERVSISFNYAW